MWNYLKKNQKQMKMDLQTIKELAYQAVNGSKNITVLHNMIENGEGQDIKTTT